MANKGTVTFLTTNEKYSCTLTLYRLFEGTNKPAFGVTGPSA